MASLAIGTLVPDAELLLTGGARRRLSDYRGQALVLYFYPKASTPGCTQEGLDFAARASEFARHGAAILGASRDSLKAQESFRARQDFPFDLVADTGEALCLAFGVIKLKQMYGKQVRGIERSTFLIDAEGVLRHEWRGVKVKDHVAEVLDAVATLVKG
jgi:peroxiredoxin Q/BCP